MTDKLEKPIVLFPINANPPHIGHLIALNTILKFAQQVYIVVYNNPQVIGTASAISILAEILSHYKDSDRIEIISSNVNFAKINEIPEKMQMKNNAYTIVTTSRNIYANLYAKGYPYLIYVSKVMGWRDEFYRIAFLRSTALENIEKMECKMIRRKKNDKQKK